MKIICISGKAGSGKDTAANFLKESLEADFKKVIITHYADLLKFIAEKYFEWDGNKDEVGRSLLQNLGTGSFRKRDPDFWIKFIARILDLFPDNWDYVIIADARYPNEMYYWKEHGYDCVTVKITAEFGQDGDWGKSHGLTEVQKQHSSEALVDGLEADFEINNDGTLQDFYEDLGFLLENIK